MSLASQFAALGTTLETAVRYRYEQSFRPMCQDIFGVLEELIERDVFLRQSEPSGARWDSISPLTVKVRRGTGKGGGTRLGGKQLPASFKAGQAGNLARIKAKTGFEFGSRLRKKSHLVARTFASNFKMPKTVTAKAGGGKRASFYKGKLRDFKNKGARIRGFMMAVAGVYAPAPGKQLTHPARPIVYWTPKWEAKCEVVVHRYLAIAFAKAGPDVDKAVRREQTRFDAMHRTSRAG